MSPVSNRRLAFLSRFGPPTLIVLGSLWLLQSVFAHTGSHGIIICNLNDNAGTVKAGSTVTDNVRVINLSSQPVEVEAQPGCGGMVTFRSPPLIRGQTQTAACACISRKLFTMRRGSGFLTFPSTAGVS